VNGRGIEIAALLVMAGAVLVGGNALLVEISSFHGVAISVLGVVAMVVLYAFRQNFRAGGPAARIHAARDAAFLAAIAAAIAFTASPARWSLGAAVVAFEIGIVVELLARVAPDAAARRGSL